MMKGRYSAGLGLGISILTAFSVMAAGPKRVLVIHSFGATAPPFTVHSTAFEEELTRQMGKQVDLDEVSLDMARYTEPDLQEAFAEFLSRRLAKWKPDLVVPVGSPAGRFVAQNRKQLFPHTPILYAGMDLRTLPPDALQTNAAFVGEVFNVANMAEDIMQLAPDTTNIVVVTGASPLEQFWSDEFRQGFAAVTNRAKLTFLGEVPFSQMREQVAHLPPHSFIFVGLLILDATGVTINEDEALQSLHAVANAPINAIWRNQLGLGIVGGRLYDAEQIGQEGARVAVSILQGEPASKFPPFLVPPSPPQYDWRELQRWHIPESRLPAGSVVRFRDPTLWERYRYRMIGVVALCLIEAGLIVLLAVNLVKRHRLTRLLREDEERVNLAANAARLVFWEWDIVRDEIWTTGWQQAWLTSPGHERLDFHRLIQAVYPDDREPVTHALARAMNGDGDFESEHRIRLPDGDVQWLLARGRVEFDAKGRALRMRGISRDITSHKQAEGQVRESETRFALMANSAPVLIWASGPDKHCTFFNQSWLDFTGRSLEQELGNGWVEGVHPDDLAACLKTYGEAFDARRPFVMEYRLRRRDGRYRWLSDTGVPRYDVQSGFAGYIGSCVDVTVRKLADEKFRLAVEASPIGIALLDREGRIVMINSRIEKLFGYTSMELTGQSIGELIPERFRGIPPVSGQEFLVSSLARNIGPGREMFMRRKDGIEFPAEIGLNPIQSLEGTLVMTTVMDLTGRKQAEADVQQQRAELAHVSRVSTLGVLAGTLAHELNQPLSAILNNAQAGSRFLASQTPDLVEVRNALADIAQDTKRASEVIRQMRALVRKGEIRFQPLDLNAAIHNVVRLLHSDSLIRRIRVVLELAPNLPPVQGENVQVQQVILNLMLNAFDAMRETPQDRRQVLLRTRQSDADSIQVGISDRGTGISPDRLENLFEPFRSSKSEGLGLGLSISHSIVTAHRGRLWADNNPGGGTTFYFTLPAQEAELKLT